MLFANVLVDTFIAGGHIMWPILGCFIVCCVVLAERTIAWTSLAKRSDSKRLNAAYDAIVAGDFAKAEHLSNAPGDPFLRTVHAGITRAHISLLGAMQLEASGEIEKADKRLWLLATFITLAPLLGLLGTVTGIKNSFDVLGGEELSQTKITGGIGEALIATACGLGIAILCLIPYNYFNRCLVHFRMRLERTINHVELLAESAKHNGSDLADFSREFAASAPAREKPPALSK
ncbi:MAG: MotA/TolQ/ExbB proton channel family protein [Puniceicoccales bacterium]|jgi:biopolymer transport protein ExbB|nr:MotA/TolQ/ExbB proton channel family protein [Puniceicoccales bacterium]